jgi:hypothetical protein
LPKKDGAEEISDFRPISLIHGIAKIIAKMLSLRLAPHMDDLVSKAQSAFIKKRSIHDNFLYVKNLATRLHKRKISALLFKLDIRKAFDSVRSEWRSKIYQIMVYKIVHYGIYVLFSPKCRLCPRLAFFIIILSKGLIIHKKNPEGTT